MPARLIAAALAGALLLPRPAARAAEPVDESALRYYAGLKQQERVEAETRRLQRLHPGWRPPADLGNERPAAEDEAPLWELFAADRLDELKARIAARQRGRPDWRPSAHLQREIRRRETRARVAAFARENRWDEVVAAAGPAAGRRDLDVATAWLVAEALARLDRFDEAALLLRGVLDTAGPTGPERAGTVQKALALLPIDRAEPLIELALSRGGQEGLDGLALDVTRARLAAFLRDQPSRPVATDEMRAFEEAARTAGDGRDAALAAWVAFKRHEWRPALDWFKLAIGRGGDATVAHGLSHALRKLGLMREAEEVAHAWREPLVNNTLLFIDLLEVDMTREIPPPIEAERIARYAAVTLAAASGEGAQALGWYAYNTCQTETALGWFSRAVAWFPKETTVMGYALALRRLGRQREFVEVVNRYDGLFPKVVDLLWSTAEPKPLPCEASRTATASAMPAGDSRFHDLRGREARGRRESAMAWSRVPSPEDSRPVAFPQVRRSEFPIAVGPENDLRFAPRAARSTDTTATTTMARTSPARSSGRDAPPVVARRVLGVGAMPYERYGFSLLPASTGETGPTAPTANDRPPPRGTLWAADEGVVSPGSLIPGSSRTPRGEPLR